MYPSGSITTDGYAMYLTFARVIDGESRKALTPFQYQLFRQSVLKQTQVPS